MNPLGISDSEWQTVVDWCSSSKTNTFRGSGYLLLTKSAEREYRVLYEIENGTSGLVIGEPGVIQHAKEGVSAWLDYAAERAPMEIRFTGTTPPDVAHFILVSPTGPSFFEAWRLWN